MLWARKKSLFYRQAIYIDCSLTPVPLCYQVLSDHKANEMTYQEKLNAEFGRSKSVEEEKELLREQIVDLRKVNTKRS